MTSLFAQTRPIFEARMGHLRRYLERHPERAVPAIELAEHLQILGGHEHKRRVIRRLVQALHGEGFRICADCHPTEGGYWLARSAEEWRRYREARERGARFEFVRTRRMGEAAAERMAGQGKLFG